MPKKLFVLLAFLVLPLGAHPAAAQSPNDRPDFERDTLQIETASGRTFDFTVELATTPRERSYGLMFVEDMPADHGMLFLFDDVAPRSFWMRNTRISLDMLFIDPEGEIINIAARAVPGDERSGQYTSDGPAAAVLEINGGLANMIGIAAGDRVVHGAFE
ncbi:DUF192 domain-containing protein [Fodinicurvata sp. EGI_FJ10296]|uniref:DUF192 domain-containing protein n=1 Tax=Fodinicurvata sp. EGI_FJ10296 TaxID=3231908 RepID=UPI0034511F3E